MKNLKVKVVEDEKELSEKITDVAVKNRETNNGNKNSDDNKNKN